MNFLAWAATFSFKKLQLSLQYVLYASEYLSKYTTCFIYKFIKALLENIHSVSVG